MASIDGPNFPEIPLDVLATTNNDALPPSLHTAAQHLLTTALQDIDQLDIEIARLESLKAQRLHDLTKIERYRCALGPHRRVPPELLSEIFLHSCSGDSERVYIPAYLNKMVWVLGRVCAKWRRVAIATPGLWTEVIIEYRDITSVSMAQYKDALESVLLRSHSLLLMLWIVSPPVGRHSIRDLIALHAPHIGALCLRGTPSRLAPLLSMPPGSFKSLETLSVNVFRCSDGSDTKVSKPISIADGATNLREITWYASCFHPGFLHIAWDHLTHLTSLNYTDTLHPRVALAILRQCPSLVACMLNIHDSSWPDTESQAAGEHLASDLDLCMTVCLPNLERLTVGYKYFGPDELLPRLELLKLWSFKAHASTRLMSWDPASTPVITRSGRLEYLSIDFKVRSADLRHLLDRTPALVDLSIEGGEPLTDDMLQLIGYGAILPRLAVLTCVLHDDDAPLTKHLDMVEERRRSVTEAISDFDKVTLNVIAEEWSDNRTFQFTRAKGLCDDKRRVVCASYMKSAT